MTTYLASIQTPMGKVKGKLTLEQKGTKLSGKIEALGMQSSFSNGTIENNRCRFSGIISTVLGTIQYDATGVIQEDKITIKAKTSKGEFTFEGRRQ